MSGFFRFSTISLCDFVVFFPLDHKCCKNVSPHSAWHQKRPLLFRICRQKKKWFMLGFNLPIIIMCKWVLDSLAFTLYGEHGCCCQQRHMSSSRPICCLGSAWLTQIYFISFFNLATFSLFSLSLLGFILFTSLLFSFVPCHEDEEANNGNSVFSKCSPCPWGSWACLAKVLSISDTCKPFLLF